MKTPSLILRVARLGLLLGGIQLALGAAETAPTTSASTFIQDQSGSAIQWQPWNAQTLQRAKAEGRPVYVFIGSFLSELTRATTKQSFITPDVVDLLNKNFLCILVDRDEQPDVAACAQHYLRTVKQLDGWPAHLWLTPELTPFEGGSYLPPSEEWGIASFVKIARQAKDAWTADPAACRSRGAEAVKALANPFPPAGPGENRGETFRRRRRLAGHRRCRPRRFRRVAQTARTRAAALFAASDTC